MAKPTHTRLALLISMLGAGLASSQRASGGELSAADLCSVPMSSNCVDRDVFLHGTTGRASAVLRESPPRAGTPAPPAVEEPTARIAADVMRRNSGSRSPVRPAPHPAALRPPPADTGSGKETDAASPATPAAADASPMPEQQAVASVGAAPSSPVAAKALDVGAQAARALPIDADGPAPLPPPNDAPPPALLAQDASRVAARQRGETTTRLLSDASPPNPHKGASPADASDQKAAQEDVTPLAEESVAAAQPGADAAALDRAAARPALDDASRGPRHAPYEPEAREKVFVASHADKVLLNLQSLLAHGGVPMDRLTEPTRDIVVGASQTDRVMASLAAVLSEYDPAPAEESAAALAAQLFDSTGGVLAGPIAIDMQQLDIDLSLDAGSALVAMAETEPGANAGGPRESIGDEAVGNGWVALSATELDGMRGGFTTHDGLKVSFGIERAVYVNGALVTATSLNVSGLGGASPGQPPAGAANTGSLALIQSGPGNAFLSGTVPASSLGTVIQNTLDNQKIQNVTVINATVNSLQILKSINLQSNLRSAVIDSLRR